MRVSGKYAYVDNVGHTKSWQLGVASNQATIRDSASPDGQEMVDGNHDWTGSVSGNGYAAIYPNKDETPFPFVGVANGRAGSLVNYVASVLFGDTTINIPVAANGGVIDWSSNFGVEGDVAKENITPYADDVLTVTVPAKNGKVAIELVPDGAIPYTDVVGVQNIRLTFSRGFSTYAEGGFIKRVINNLSASISFDVQNDDLLVVAYASGSVKRVKVYATGVLFWLFDAITWGDLSNFVVDTTTDSIVGYTVNGSWTALRTRAVPGLGTIVLPGGTVLYPAP